MKKTIWLVLLGVMGGLVAAGVLFLITRSPGGKAIQLLPPPTASPLVVHVTGAVAVPGVYSLPPGSRVADALDSAGGITDQADPQSLNLAQVIIDGQRIHVPEKSAPTHTSDPEAPVRSIVVPSGLMPTGLININTADQAELESLPEIGPHLAGEIIAYREVNGLFKTVDELLEVTGIGPVILETIRELVTVGELP
jgi:competence protein ComEA